jgi:hypothetical protein
VIDTDYIGRKYNPEVDIECQACIYRAPEFCPCEVVEIIPISDEECKRIVDNLSKGGKC